MKAYINTPYKKKQEFSAFLKKNIREKKKNHIIISRTTLCTQKTKFCMYEKNFGQNLLAYKIQFVIYKSLKLWGKLEINFLAIKKTASHTISLHGNCMTSIFSKPKTSDFHHQIVLLESNSRRN